MATVRANIDIGPIEFWQRRVVLKDYTGNAISLVPLVIESQGEIVESFERFALPGGDDSTAEELAVWAERNKITMMIEHEFVRRAA